MGNGENFQILFHNGITKRSQDFIFRNTTFQEANNISFSKYATFRRDFVKLAGTSAPVAAVALAAGTDAAEAQPVDSGSREFGHGDFESLVFVQASVFKRVGFVTSLAHSLLVECVFVDDQDSAVLQILEVRLKCGGVHRNQCIKRVARRENVG